MHRAAIVGLLLLLGPLAGCAGGPNATGDESPTQQDEEATDRLHPPAWSVGQYWTWRTGEGEEVTYVVTGEEAEDWIVDTTSEQVAFFHARFPISTLGAIRKADLAGSQPDTRVTFFDWPLEANKTWTTTWDDVEREITVDRIEDGTAHLTARQDGRVAVAYTYDRERGSFGQLIYLDENGTRTFAMEPVDHGERFGEPAVRWQLGRALDEGGTFGPPPAASGFGFTVPEGASDLWLDLAVDCPGQGGYDVRFGPSGDAQTDQGSSYAASDVCPAQANTTGVVVEAPTPGEYRGGITATSALEGTYDVTLLVRTLEQVPVGEG